MIKIKVLSESYFSANCYFVYDESEMKGLIIDPTVPYERVQSDPLLSQICIEYILLTHCHFDHLLYYEEWREKTHAKTAIGAEDAEGLSQGQINLSPMFIRKNQIYSKADILLHDGDTLAFGNRTVVVLSTAGHTSGSVCYQIDGHLFSGDTLFANGDIGRTDFPTGNEQLLRASLARLMTLSDGTRVYPGHGPATTIALERPYHQ